MKLGTRPRAAGTNTSPENCVGIYGDKYCPPSPVAVFSRIVKFDWIPNLNIQYQQLQFGFWRNDPIYLSFGGLVIFLANGGTLSELELRVLYSSSFQFSLGRPVVDSLAQVWNSWPIMQSQAGVDTGHRGEDRRPGETQRPRHWGHQHLLCHGHHDMGAGAECALWISVWHEAPSLLTRSIDSVLLKANSKDI